MSTENMSVRLRCKKNDILEEWKKRVKSILPAARAQTSLQLTNAIPLFLDHLADVLSKPSLATETGDYKGTGKEHGEQRASLREYDLPQVHKEYEVLRDVLFEFLSQPTPLTPDERECVLRSIFIGVRDAVVEFSSRQLHKEQEYSEKLRVERDLREQFVATLTHDLRSPLQSIKANGFVISQHGDNVEIRKKALSSLNLAVDRTGRMISNLLDVNQIRTGNPLKLEIREVELCTLIRETASDFASLHGDRFDSVCNAPIAGFWCPLSLRRALENLLDNAVKYGAPETRIVVRGISTETGVVIEVNNKGTPIPLSIQEKIFEPYFRSASADATSKGWGLGLSLVRGIAEAHGGRVEVRSSDIEGTTFSVILLRDARKPPAIEVS